MRSLSLSLLAALTACAPTPDGAPTTSAAHSTAQPARAPTATLPLGSGARVVVSATMADGHAVQARFVNN